MSMVSLVTLTGTNRITGDTRQHGGRITRARRREWGQRTRKLSWSTGQRLTPRAAGPVVCRGENSDAPDSITGRCSRRTRN